MSDAEDPKSSRRKRRGHKQGEPAPATKGPVRHPKVEPRAYAEAQTQLEAFVRQRMGKLVEGVGAGFFNGATEAEVKNPELQKAFYLFFVLGYRDKYGMRAIDAFRTYATRPDPMVRRAIDAMANAKLVLGELTERNEANRQMVLRDLFRGEELRAVDKAAYASIDAGGGILGWFMPSGEVWRPVEVATVIPAGKMPGASVASTTLGDRFGVAQSQVPDRHPAETFWTIYRVANG